MTLAGEIAAGAAILAAAAAWIEVRRAILANGAERGRTDQRLRALEARAGKNADRLDGIARDVGAIRVSVARLEGRTESD